MQHAWKVHEFIMLVYQLYQMMLVLCSVYKENNIYYESLFAREWFNYVGYWHVIIGFA